MDDIEAAAFYARPENQQPVGPARRRKDAKTLSSHVPVRFTPTLIAAVKRLADEDGVTVSTWIRNVVVREVEHRSQARTMPTPGLTAVVERKYGDASTFTSTGSFGQEPVPA